MYGKKPLLEGPTDGRTDGPSDGPMDQETDGWTHALMESLRHD